MGNALTYAYNPKGNMAAKTDPEGNTIAYSYDKINRLLEKTYPDGSREVLESQRLRGFIPSPLEGEGEG